MGKATEGMIEIATDIAEELCLMDELEEILDSEDNFYDVSDFIDEYKYEYLKMDKIKRRGEQKMSIKDKLIEIAKDIIDDNSFKSVHDRGSVIIAFEEDEYDCICNEIADSIIENLPELLSDGEWVKLPIGWLNCLKLLACGASCYASIMDILQKEMKENKEYANLYFKIPQVQGSGNRFDLDYLSESKIDINTINGFEELLEVMRFTKQRAEEKLAKIKENNNE